MDNRDIVFIEPETVHIEQMKKDFAPLSQRISTVVNSSDVVLIGEGNHFDGQTKDYSEQIFRIIIASSDKKPVVFLEARSVTDKVINHFDYAVKYCEENGIPYYAVDTSNTGHNSPNDGRDVAMAKNIEKHMENYPNYRGIFIGGSNHCSKDGSCFRDFSEQYNDGYSYENTASLLGERFRVGSVLCHYTHRKEILARSVDTSNELMCLPGKYANFYASKRFSSFGKVEPLRFSISDNAFDLVTFVPTLESRICRIFGDNPEKKISYLDDDIK